MGSTEPNRAPNHSVDMPDRSERAELSDREREILVWVASGASNKEVAQRLAISPNTVKVHVRNIFGKIGVSSRTEAALYAIREGLVPAPTSAPGEAPTVAPEEAEQETEPESPTPGSSAAAHPPGKAPAAAHEPAARARPSAPAGALGRVPIWARRLALLLLAVAVLGVATLAAPRLGLAPTAVAPTAGPAATLMPRWTALAPLPTPRSGLGLAAYEGRLYAIAGQAGTAVTGAVEIYDIQADRWTAGQPKPQPVADVGAAVIGRLIYVPGGRTVTGEVTDQLEVYDPGRDAWEQRSPLPVALSAYALAVFEGKLYVFGGWDGSTFVSSTFAYDPELDEWAERTRMPTPRGFAAAAVAGERIYVVGGQDRQQAQSVNEAYAPSQDASDGRPWQPLSPLAQGRSHLAAGSVAATVHVFGGEPAGQAQALFFDQASQVWLSLEAPPGSAGSPSSPAAVAQGSTIHLVGGRVGEAPSGQHLRFQAVFIVPLPAVSP